MFKWLTPKSVLKDSLETDVDIYKHIENLWTCHNQLAELMKSITEIMKNMAEGIQINREDFEHLAQQTLRIADQQNKLLAHIMRTDDMINEDMESKRLH